METVQNSSFTLNFGSWSIQAQAFGILITLVLGVGVVLFVNQIGEGLKNLLTSLGTATDTGVSNVTSVFFEIGQTIGTPRAAVDGYFEVQKQAQITEQKRLDTEKEEASLIVKRNNDSVTFSHKGKDANRSLGETVKATQNLLPPIFSAPLPALPNPDEVTVVAKKVSGGKKFALPGRG